MQVVQLRIKISAQLVDRNLKIKSEIAESEGMCCDVRWRFRAVVLCQSILMSSRERGYISAAECFKLLPIFHHFFLSLTVEPDEQT